MDGHKYKNNVLKMTFKRCIDVNRCMVYLEDSKT